MIRLMSNNDLQRVHELLENHSGIWNREWTMENVENAFRSANYSLVYFLEDELVACFFAYKTNAKVFFSGFTIDRKELRSKVSEEMIEYYCQNYLEPDSELLIADMTPKEIMFYKVNGWFRPHTRPNMKLELGSEGF